MLLHKSICIYNEALFGLAESHKVSELQYDKESVTGSGEMTAQLAKRLLCEPVDLL